MSVKIGIEIHGLLESLLNELFRECVSELDFLSARSVEKLAKSDGRSNLELPSDLCSLSIILSA